MDHNIDLKYIKRETTTTATGDVASDVISLSSALSVQIFANVFAISGTNASLKLKKVEFSKTSDFSDANEITSYSKTATTGGNIAIAFHTSDYITPNNPNERGSEVADVFDQSELKVVGQRRFSFSPSISISSNRGYLKVTYEVSGTNPSITWNSVALIESTDNPVIPA